MRTITLRVGICSCSRYYRGRIQNLRLESSGCHFRLQEMTIPEGSQTEAVKKKGCHFFLDLHYDEDMQPPYLAEVILENFQRLLPHDRDIRQEIQWERDKPVPVPEVVEAIDCLLKGLRPKELRQWLKGLARPQRQAR